MASPASPDWDELFGGFDIDLPVNSPAAEQSFPGFATTRLQDDLWDVGSGYQGQTSFRKTYSLVLLMHQLLEHQPPITRLS